MNPRSKVAPINRAPIKPQPPPPTIPPRVLRTLGGTALAILAIERRSPGIKLAAIAAELGISDVWCKKLRRRLVKQGLLRYRRADLGSAEDTNGRNGRARVR